MFIPMLTRDPDDFLVDNDRPHVIARYFEYIGGEVSLPVWAEDIPDEVWELAEADEEAEYEEDDDDEG